jgi:DNA-binding transcriptional LysR family regulator
MINKRIEMSISIRRLELFDAIVRLGKLTTAADTIAMSQSAASQALKDLESSLPSPLFNRVGRELVLTDFGLQTLPEVRQILSLIANLQAPQPNNLSGQLKLIASETIASYLLPSLVSQFIKQYPKVHPDIKIGNSKLVIDSLEKGIASIGFIEGPILHQKLVIQSWQTDELQIFCHPNHKLAEKKSISFNQIQSEKWILREQGSGTRAIFDNAVERIGAQLSDGIELTRQSAIKESVKAELGIGCLSKLVINEEVRRGALIPLSSELDLTRRLSIVTNQNNKINRISQQFLEHISSNTP